MPRGKPFTGKNDPRIGKNGGRKRKSVAWKDAEETLREALPRVLLMSKNDLQALLQSNPTGAEMLAAKYIHEHVPAAVERFLGKTPSILTGADGEPLIPKPITPALPPISFIGWTPEQLDKFIENTSPKPQPKQEPPKPA